LFHFLFSASIMSGNILSVTKNGTDRLHGVQGASAIVDAKLQRFYSHHPGILGIFFAYVV